MLLSQPGADRLALSGAPKQALPGAIDRAMGISFSEYTSNVLAYLDPEQAGVHAGKAAFGALQDLVVARLEALR